MAETIDKLKTENEELKKRIYDLEKENSLLKGRISKLEEKPYELEQITPVKPTPTYTPVTSMETEEIEAISVTESFNEPEVEIAFDIHAPVPTLGGGDKPIIEGYSRRICPHCDNNRQMSIQEKIDKKNILMQYPRIYGKKYVCGLCGTNWVVKTE
ncbi:MAG: hypothetical protein KGD58_15735 [Candidatus Lokiarchaeota archaeon]|nr:hypothetical protein [Candidatus Lokiarchaeota archaeon]